MTFLQIDPNSVVAGWVPMVLIALLAVVTYFLYRGVRKHLARIDIPDGGVPTRRVKADEPDPKRRPAA